MSNTENSKKTGQKRGPMPGGRGRSLMPGEKAKDMKGTLIRLIRYLGRYKGLVFISIVLAVISTGMAVAGPKVLGEATTTLFTGFMAQLRGSGSINFEKIGRILLKTLILYGGSTVLSYGMGWILSRVSTQISYRFRKEITDKIHTLPLKYYDKTTHGEILSRITNDVDTISQTLNQSLSQIIISLVTVMGVLVMMFSVDWRMTLVALAIIPISGVLIKGIVKRSQKHFKQQQKSLGEVNGHIEEMFSGHRVIKAFNGEEKSVKTFGVFNRKLYKSAWMSQFLSGLIMPLMRVISNMGYVVIAILGGWLAARGHISVGDIQAFIQYIRRFTQPLTNIANITNILQQTAAAAERVFEFLDEDQEIDETDDPVSPEKVEGHVAFEHVHFGYDPENPVIKDFSVKADPGKKIAIVGPTGAGKTTLVKLLMRFYDVDSGAITIDGHNIREFTRNDLRQNFAMVLQDSWLYNDTVMENIRYGRPGATDKEVFDAAKAAHVDHFIHTWPGGYSMEINEETNNISQGQKQLLTIARAILADPGILILDEATSSVDTRTEELIQRAMDHLMEGRTSFVIAHRLSTIKNADMILVMDKGDIIEKGNHNELMKADGFYADLYNSQFEQSAQAV